MRRILAANWFVIRRSHLLILICIVMLVVAVFAAQVNVFDRRSDHAYQLEQEGMALPSSDTWKPLFQEVTMGVTPGLGIVFAFLISMVLNDQFSSGDIRDKIIGGFSRTSIYLSCFLSSFAACMVVLACTLAGDLTVIPVTDMSEMSAAKYFAAVGLLTLNTAAYCAIYTFVAMLVCTRSGGRGLVCLIITCVIFIVFLIVFAQVDSMLMEPETYQDYAYDQETESFVQSSPVPNPNYLGPEARERWMTLLRILPVSQAVMVVGFEPDMPLWMALYSCLICASLCLVGDRIFSRRDLS